MCVGYVPLILWTAVLPLPFQKYSTPTKSRVQVKGAHELVKPTMLLGVLLGIGAGALWGLIYIAPLFVPSYNPVLFAMGRFIAFGLLSLPLLWFLRQELKAFSKADVLQAFLLPLFGNLGFYILLTISIRLSGAPLAGMLTSTIPVLVAIVANMRARKTGQTVPWKVIMPPLVIIIAGLILANWSECLRIAEQSEIGSDAFWIGLGFGLAAMGAWTWFSIFNSEWLLRHPNHSTVAWTTLQGVTVLPVAALGFAVLAWPLGFMNTTVSILGDEPTKFLLTIFSVGLLCSWIAMCLWNQMSQRLPAGLGGQLIVFESIFAVIYGLMYRGEAPEWTMVVGYIILLVGVIGSLRAFQSAQKALEASRRQGAQCTQAPLQTHSCARGCAS